MEGGIRFASVHLPERHISAAFHTKSLPQGLQKPDELLIRADQVRENRTVVVGGLLVRSGTGGNSTATEFQLAR